MRAAFNVCMIVALLLARLALKRLLTLSCPTAAPRLQELARTSGNLRLAREQVEALQKEPDELRSRLVAAQKGDGKV